MRYDYLALLSFLFNFFEVIKTSKQGIENYLQSILNLYFRFLFTQSWFNFNFKFFKIFHIFYS